MSTFTPYYKVQLNETIKAESKRNIFVFGDFNDNNVRARALALKALIYDITGIVTKEIKSISIVNSIKREKVFLIILGKENFVDFKSNSIKTLIFHTEFKCKNGKFQLHEKAKPFKLFIHNISKVNENSTFIKSSKNSISIEYDFLGKYYKNLESFGVGQSNVNEICTIQRLFRIILSRFIGSSLIDIKSKPSYLFTIDSEDQHNYFDNQNKRCTDITGSKNNLEDMRFSNLVLETINRFSKYGILPIFMVTGSDLTSNSRDGFGNLIDQPIKNINALKSISRSGKAGIGLHGMDHNAWLRYGYSQEMPMTLFKKFQYFLNSGGSISLFLRFFYFVIVMHFRAVKDKPLGSTGEHSKIESVRQIGGLIKYLSKNSVNLTPIHRAPGFRRSNSLVYFLEKYKLADSTDQFLFDKNLAPSVPYSLLKVKNKTISLAKVKEYPCIFIDKYFRTSKTSELDFLINLLNNFSKYNETVLTIISHTKITGGDFSHCHIYPRSPLSGLALPPKKENLYKILRKISLKFNQFKLN